MEKISISTIVDQNIEKAWIRYTDPNHIVNWNFASDDWHCPHASNDLSVGGKYIARMEAKDGSFGFDFEAVYDAITLGRSFSYTMEDGRSCTVDFYDQGEKTLVEVSFDPESINSLELQRDGWQSILNNFKKYVESIA
jgi:uncharacterized protein YndB with AHSA1/START domain